MDVSIGARTVTVSPGSIVGLIGDDTRAISDLLRRIGGRWIGPGDELNLSAATVVSIAYALDLRDAGTRLLADSRLEALRRQGAKVFLASHDTGLLSRISDEVWWIQQGELGRQGHPDEVLTAYARHTAQRIRAEARETLPIHPTMRRGDGRAELLTIETSDAAGGPCSVWQSGEEVQVRLKVRFHAPVPDPVAGIMIRTRIGMEVYGTNTELENVMLGPCQAGGVRTIVFRFVCNLCPGYYTITAASHDPDGVWHDWMEDAIGITVADHRYTAGVANLRAEVTCFPE